MGGGASAMADVDQLLSTTMMIGRAIAAITFPGMFRIYDFHSTKAPKLKNQRQFSFFAPDSDDEDDDEDNNGIPDPSEYAHLFNVQVGEDQVYLEDPTFVNEAGWTALHTCCMSFLTVNAGIALIDETIRRGKSVDVKTLAGPGTFNSQWTALHMACAYGISPLVEKLIEEGANVNTFNSFGYTPLLEACHRGFLNIVEALAKAGADLSYIPSDEDSFQSPFVSAPAQSALGESARCGFVRICQALLDAGAVKDQVNSLGWTPLHEACFYNRIEVVKLLLLSGAMATVRTRGGALPFHLAGLQLVRTMITDMGGPGAVPAADDTIDMVSVLRELTMPDYGEMMASEDNDGTMKVEYSMKGPVSAAGEDGGGHLVVASSSSSSVSRQTTDAATATTNVKKQLHEAGSKEEYTTTGVGSGHKNASGPGQGLGPGLDSKNNTGINSMTSPQQFLHSGRILGDLPSLPGNMKSPGSGNGKLMNAASTERDINRALLYGDSASPDMLKADGKDRNTSTSNGPLKMKKKKKAYEPPADIPRAYLCQLSNRPMSEPVKSTYGHVYEKRAIEDWIAKQGHVCPLTGAPLAETDLKSMEDLGHEIREWILQSAMKPTSNSASSPSNSSSNVNNSSSGGEQPSHGSRQAASAATAATDDLYDF